LSDAHVVGPSSGRVVVGVGAANRATAALDFAFATAHRQALDLTVVHAWTPPAPGAEHHAYAATNAAYHELKELLASYSSTYPEVDIRLSLMPVPVTVALQHQSKGAALLVLGARRRRRPLNLLAGSTLRAVLDRASSPVALVPSPAAG
jgi:nucleotide-binding universal stress UspA family protein